MFKGALQEETQSHQCQDHLAHKTQHENERLRGGTSSSSETTERTGRSNMMVDDYYGATIGFGLLYVIHLGYKTTS
jgi:hypothetical protein